MGGWTRHRRCGCSRTEAGEPGGRSPVPPSPSGPTPSGPAVVRCRHRLAPVARHAPGATSAPGIMRQESRHGVRAMRAPVCPVRDRGGGAPGVGAAFSGRGGLPHRPRATMMPPPERRSKHSAATVHPVPPGPGVSHPRERASCPARTVRTGSTPGDRPGRNRPPTPRRARPTWPRRPLC